MSRLALMSARWVAGAGLEPEVASASGLVAISPAFDDRPRARGANGNPVRVTRVFVAGEGVQRVAVQRELGRAVRSAQLTELVGIDAWVGADIAGTGGQVSEHGSRQLLTPSSSFAKV